MLRTAAWLAAPGFIAAALTGCASFSPDAGMSAVNAIVAPELRADAVRVDTGEGDAAARALTRRLLATSLSANAAVQVALVNNKGLQAAYNELGAAEATKVADSLPPNPAFSIGRISTPVELDVEGRIVADILTLATLPARSEVADDRFRQAQLRAAQETLRVGTETRRSYFRALAARQVVDLLIEAAAAADASEKLSKQLVETGAMSKLDRTREQVFSAEIAAQLVAARAHAASEREQLIRALGLAGSDIAVRLPSALPPMPKRPRTVADAEVEAIRRRVDLQIARIEVEALAKSYGLTQATRFINLLDVSGVSRTQSESSGARGTGGGAEVEFQIPIFDFGETRRRQAGESYMAAVNRLAEQSVDVASEARDACQAYRSAYDIAVRYHDQIVPLQKTIADETTLRYGAMQVDVFSLLAEARQRLATSVTAIEAQRDFWLANVDLEDALIGGGAAVGDREGTRAAANVSSAAARE
jgi:outer membrane protein TolC